MLSAKGFGQRSAGIAIAAFGLVRGVDEAIGDATHGGDDDGDGKLLRRVGDNRSGAADAGSVADRSATKLHHLQF